MAQTAVADVPRLIAELHAAIQSETRRPISPAVLRISTRIETAAMTAPKIEVAEDSEWRKFNLTPTEAKLAEALRSQIGRAVRRDALFSALYPDDSETRDPKMIDVLVCKINRKVAGWYRVQNVFGFGYKLVWTRRWGNPRDVVEWRGIFMGRKASMMAEALFAANGRFLPQRELAVASGSNANAVGRIMAGLRKNLLASPYKVENVRCAGYRMVRV